MNKAAVEVWSPNVGGLSAYIPKKTTAGGERRMEVRCKRIRKKKVKENGQERKKGMEKQPRDQGE